MKKRLTASTVALFLAAVLVFSAFGFVLAEETTAENVVYTDFASFGLLDYHVYLTKQPSVAAAGEKLALSLEAPLSLAEEETATFRLQVEKEGMYYLSLAYSLASDSPAPSFLLTLDGEVPYRELEEYALSGVYTDGEKRFNGQNDQLISHQTLVDRVVDGPLINPSAMTDSALGLYLSEGEHTITLTAKNNAFNLHAMTFGPEAEIPTDEAARKKAQLEGVKPYDGEAIFLEAEEPFEKSSQSLYALYDRSSPATTPYHETRIRRNTIGGSNWSSYGQWLSYKVVVEEEGLYYISFKYRQGDSVDVTTCRNIYVNDVLQSESFRNVAFAPNVSWSWLTVSDENKNAVPLRLQKGENIIRVEASQGKFTSVLSRVSHTLDQLNDLYIRIVMVTGTLPDSNRDYRLEAEIPGLLEAFAKHGEDLADAADLLDELTGEKSSAGEDIRAMSRRVLSFVERPSQIPWRLTDYRNGISSLNAWVTNMKSQPLELDAIALHPLNETLPAANAGFFAQLAHEFRLFFASFYEDYSGDVSTDEEALRVWVNMGRDQIQVIRDLVTDSFSATYDVPVYLSVVQTGLIEATLAGRSPDVALSIARGQPVNLAVRGALLDFTKYENYENMVSRFAEGATTPYTFEEGVYGIPCSQSFFVMFYRKDILVQLDAEVPETWDELLKIVPKLQRSHMNIGLPYAVISAAAAVDNGLGAKDLYATLLLQEGGTFYREDGTATMLHTEEAMTAFDSWCRFYTRYGFDLIYDFYTRFTSGEMPIAIASFDTIQTLSIAAEEIRGQWEIAPIPGVRQADGSIRRTEAGSGTAAVIFANTTRPQDAYHFVDWWTSDKTQTDFCGAAERLLGPGGRYATANLAAFAGEPWGSKRLDVLQEQRRWVQELPEIPGSYYVTRSIDNAFRSVIYDKKNARESFEKENRSINREIIRKRQELGLFIPEEISE